MATAKDQFDNAGAITPPAFQRGGRGVTVDPELLNVIRDTLAKGEYATDGVEYESRQDANTAMARVKKALVNDNTYDEPAKLKSRTWALDGKANDDPDARFQWALVESERVK